MKRRIALLVALTTGSAAAAPTGWRHDGSGIYPEAKPVLEWSAEEAVVWKADLPDWGNGMPVVVGDLVVVGAEPDRLLAFDAEDGSLRWSAATPMVDALPEEERERLERNRPKIEALQKEADELYQQVRRLQRGARRAKDEAKKQELETELEAARKGREALMEEIQGLGMVVPVTFHATGYSTPTPASDGERIYVNYGTGVVAAFDLEGERLWARIHQVPERKFGHSSSPRLVDGKLIVHVIDLLALDPASGEVLWTVDTNAAWGTAAVARIGDESVLVTPHGKLVRVRDGAVLADKLFNLSHNSPLVAAGVIYAVKESGAVALRLPESIEGDAAEVETLWKSEPLGGRHYASPVLHEGLLYAADRERRLSALDAASGELVKAEVLEMGRGKHLFASLSLAGGHLFVTHDNGTTAVVRPGRDFEVVATNPLGLTRSTPLFAGERIFFRTDEHLYCLGETTDSP